ncbi:MAG: FlgD immunoglobulin-like domain containing protein, partial [Bacteroidota bacterium]
PNGGNDGKLANGFENTSITTETAYTGTKSLKFDLPFNRAPHDAWVGTQRFPLENGPEPTAVNAPADISVLNARPGDLLRISIWVKASNLVPDSAAMYPGTWSVGLTPIFHSGYTANAPYDEIGAKDLVFAFPAVTEFDWTQYYVDVQVPDDPNAKALSVRIHPYSRFTGKIYFDELEVRKIGTTGVTDNVIPVSYSLEQNYPNPFNPSTTISYTLPERASVSLKIYDMLGREVKTLFSGEQNAGVQRVVWSGDSNSGLKVSSGIYIYRIEAGRFIQSRKMILLK